MSSPSPKLGNPMNDIVLDSMNAAVTRSLALTLTVTLPPFRMDAYADTTLSPAKSMYSCGCSLVCSHVARSTYLLHELTYCISSYRCTGLLHQSCRYARASLGNCDFKHIVGITHSNWPTLQLLSLQSAHSAPHINAPASAVGTMHAGTSVCQTLPIPGVPASVCIPFSPMYMLIANKQNPAHYPCLCTSTSMGTHCAPRCMCSS